MKTFKETLEKFDSEIAEKQKQADKLAELETRLTNTLDGFFKYQGFCIFTDERDRLVQEILSKVDLVVFESN